MAELKFTVKMMGLDDVIRSLSQIKEGAPQALAKSLTQVAKATRDAQVETMRTVFDRPNPFVLNSLYVWSATPNKLQSSVNVREFAGKGTQAEKFLGPQIFGGTRSLKKFEKALQYKGILPKGMYAIPGRGADFDGYGNMKASQIVQILSYFAAFGEQGYRANTTAAKKAKMKKGTKRVQGFVYFVIPKRVGKLPAGIYKRSGSAWGSPIKQILVFVKQPSYSKRFDFFEIGEGVMEKEWEAIFAKNIQDALDRAK
ncbi:MAG: hypothetical protein WCJ37_02565 [Syntrophus sp. (in: bacteria)]